MLRTLSLACLALALWAAPATSQVVRGVVRELGSPAPVEGAMVILTDLDGKEAHRVLTDADGRFIAHADHPGPHVIRIDRIGYESLVTERFDVPVAGTFQEVLVPIRPVELVGIDVEASRRCEVRPEQGQATARVWEEARKALEAAAWTLSSGSYRYTLLHFVRDLNAGGTEVVKEDRDFVRSWAQAPYVSLPAEELLAKGYVQPNEDGTSTYYAPDAEVLLSDAFLDTHCMSLREVRDGSIALAFEPTRVRDLPDVEGVLWIEAETATLQRMEFEYVNLPRDQALGEPGGQVEFGRLPNGAWIVRDWYIRMPRLAWAGAQRTRLIRIGYQDEGGTVWRVTDPSGVHILEAVTATLAGVVTDSLGALPLAGVQVSAGDGGNVSETGDAGSFLLPGLAPGLQSVTLSHPSLDSLGLSSPPVSTEAMEGEVTSIRVRMPGVGELVSEACGEAPDTRPSSIIFGRVTGAPFSPAGVTVRARWLASDGRGFQPVARAAPERAEGPTPSWTSTDRPGGSILETRLDSRGIFLLCHVPHRSEVIFEADRDGGPTVTRRVTVVPGDAVVTITLSMKESRAP